MDRKGYDLQNKINERLEMRPEGIATTSESENDPEEELDTFELEQERKLLIRKKNPNKTRESVSAEVYGEYNKKGNFKPPVHQKSKEQVQKIISLIDKSFLFKHLEKKDKETIALAMKSRTLSN